MNPPRPTRSAKHDAMRGSLWTLGGYGASQIVRLASSLILARLLFPAAFGLMSLVNVFMQGLEMFSDIGLGPSIIQHRRGDDPKFLRTAWTLQIARGLLLWLVACALARPAAAFFGARDPLASQLTVVLPVAGLMALFGGFTSTAVHVLNRRLAMRRLTLLALLPQLVTLLVSIAWAYIDRSVWAIVGGGLAGSLARLLLSHAFNDGPRDRLGWDSQAARELEHFGKWIFLSTIVSFLASNLDRVVLGRLLALSELGLYSIGMTFARVATQVATRLTNTVLFPLLSKYRDKPARLLAFAVRARAAVLWAGGATCAGFALFAPAFFGLLYDPRYAGAGLISQWLSLHIWSWMLNATIDRIPLALGRSRALFTANLAGTFGMLLAWLGYRIAQLPGFIAGMALSNLAAHICLQFAIPPPRAPLARQSLLATLAVAAYTLPALWLLHLLAPRLTPVADAVLRALLAGAPPALAVLVVRRMMSLPAPAPEQVGLARDISARRLPCQHLRQRGEDVLIARATAADGRSVIVKLWNRPGLRGALRRFSATTIARREWEALTSLRRAGLGVPEPLACFSLPRRGARHTEALIESDLGDCRDATEVFKALRREGRAADEARFEQALIDTTAAMLEQGWIDVDHRLPNFVVPPDGIPVRLDFELARRVRRPRRHERALGQMIGTLAGSFLFAVQPDSARAAAFIRRLQERLVLPPGVLKEARARLEQMAARQRSEIGLDTRVEWPW